MKKVMIIALIMIGFQLNAQEKQRGDREGRNDRMAMMKDLSAEEIATLQTKRMTLQLDLSESQQGKVKSIFQEETKFKKSRMAEMKARKDAGDMERPSKDQRLKMMNERLDRQIAMKRKMKDILDDQQYDKWEKSLSKRGWKKGRKGHSPKSKRK